MGKLRGIYGGDRVAVIGLGCVLPGALTVGALWEMLHSGVSRLGALGPQHFNPTLHPTLPRQGGVAQDFRFDRKGFRVPPVAVPQLDRAQQLAMTAALEAFADSGYHQKRYDHDRTGVIVGTSANTLMDNDKLHSRTFHWNRIQAVLEEALRAQGYDDSTRQQVLNELRTHVLDGIPPLNGDSLPGLLMNVSAGRIASTLNVRGPTFAVDGSDAGAIIALERASSLLLDGQLDLAVVVGAQAPLSPAMMHARAQLGLLSRSGHHPFDAEAGGYCLGEGAGAFVLKRLHDAETDGDTIHAVIGGFGHAGKLGDDEETDILPDAATVCAAARAAYHRSDFSPATLQYLETTGTGVPALDSAELLGLSQAFQPYLPRGRKLSLGSVGGQTGHLLGASGAASLLRVIMCMREKHILPTVGHHSPHPEIPWSTLALELPSQPVAWPENAGGLPRRAGVSTLDCWGSAWHVALEEYKPDFHKHRALRRSSTPRGTPAEPIAVIAAGTRLPGCEDTHAFWSLLSQQRSALVPLSDEYYEGFRDAYFSTDPERPAATYAMLWGKAPDPAPNSVCQGLSDDARARMDRPQALLLQALEELRADWNPTSPVDPTKTGIFLGLTKSGSVIWNSLTGTDLWRELEHWVTHSSTLEGLGWDGPRRASLLTALDKAVNLGAPALTRDSVAGVESMGTLARAARITRATRGRFALDAACAGSLVALDAAIHALRGHTCDVVVAGGMTHRGLLGSVLFAKGGALSKGQARPFEEDADGFALGEGSTLFVLKRLKDAIVDGDRIYGVIRGIGGSCDGKGKSVVAPSSDGQLLALKRAYAQAQVSPDSIQLVECHGTGTALGDAVELETLHRFFGPASAPGGQRIALGSVKSQIGHTLSNAASASLLKVLLGLSKLLIPPTAPVAKPTAGLKLEEGPFYLADQCVQWPENQAGEPRRAGVNSFGFGGANWHLIVEGYEPAYHRPLVGLPESNDALDASKRERLAVLFPGQGSQFPDMGAELYAEYEVVRETFQLANQVLAPVLHQRLEDLIFVSSSMSREACEANLRRNEIALPAITTVNLALYRVLTEMLQLRPDLISAHSFGEFAALAASGALDSSDAILASYRRGHLLDEARAQGIELGAMAAVAADVHHVRAFLASIPGFVTIGNRNCSSQTVISGESSAVQAAVTAFQREGIQATFIPVAAMHSAIAAQILDPRADEFISCLRVFSPRIPLLSSVDQRYYPMRGDCAAQVVANLRNQAGSPLDFVGIIERLYEDGARTFIECGAKSALTSFVKDILTGKPHRTHFLLHPKQDGRKLLQTLEKTLLGTQSSTVAVQSAPLAAGGPAPSSEVRSSAPTQQAPVTTAPTQPSSWIDGNSLGFAGRRYFLRDVQGDGSILVLVADSVQDVQRTGVTALGSGQERRSTETLRATASEAEGTSSRNTLALPTPAMSELDPKNSRAQEDGLEALIVACAVEKTQYEPELLELDADLEGELGIDSLKQVQILVAIRERLGVPSDPSFEMRKHPTLRHWAAYFRQHAGVREGASVQAPGAVPMSAQATQLIQSAKLELPGAPSASQAAGNDALLEILLECVMDKTQYERELLELDADLEGELGIDSLKQVQILTALRERLALPNQQDFELRKHPTLRDWAAYFSRQTDMRVDTRLPVAGSALNPAQPASSASAGLQAPHATSPSEASAEENALTELILTCVMEKTQYERELLELDADLEGELGIDSLKQVQILTALRAKLPLTADPGFELRKNPTLRHWIESFGRLSVAEEHPTEPAQSSQEDRKLEPTSLTQAGRPVDESEVTRLLAQLGAPFPQDQAIHCPLRRDDLHKEAIPTEEGVKANAMHLDLPSVIRRWTLNVTEKALEPGLIVDRTGWTVLVTDDGRGFAAPVCRQLERLGMRPVVLDTHWLGADEQRIEAAVAQAAASSSVMGLVHLAGLAEEPSLLESTPASIRPAVDRSTRLLFLLCRRLAPALGQGGFLLSVTGMGGDFGISAGAALSISSAAISGLTKSIAREFPQAQVKLLDIARDSAPEALASWMGAELGAFDPSLEVGYRGGKRLVPVLDAQTLDLTEHVSTMIFGAEMVAVVTGGARGIGAAVARVLAKAHACVIILVGSTPILPEAQAWEDQHGADPSGLELQALRSRLTREFKAIRPSAGVREVETHLAPYLRSIEIVRTLKALEQLGARASYHACDVQDADQTQATFAQIVQRYGRIDVVLHAAGIADDKALVQKSLSSFDRVFDLKVNGTLNVWKAVRTHKPGFLGLFASVSGRFGNPGQADYSAANEVQSKLARAFSALQPETRSVAFGWGAWSDVGIAARMGVAESMRRSGRTPISPAEGGEIVLRELCFGGRQPEIFLAELTEGVVRGLEVRGGSRMQQAGAVTEPKKAREHLACIVAESPLLDTLIAHEPGASVCVGKTFDPALERWIPDHHFYDVPLLPAVIMLETMAEAARLLVPDLGLIEAQGFKIFKSLKFIKLRPCQVQVTAQLLSDLDPSGRRRVRAWLEAIPEVSTKIQGSFSDRCRAQVDLIFEPQRAAQPQPLHEERFSGRPSLASGDVYRFWGQNGFGKHFQLVDELTQVGDSRCVARSAPLHEEVLIPAGRQLERLAINPFALDFCLQACGSWLVIRHHLRAIPGELTRLRIYARPVSGEVLTLHARLTSQSLESPQFEFVCTGESGRVLFLAEGSRTIPIQRFRSGN